jgi:hypothetical protein
MLQEHTPKFRLLQALLLSPLWWWRIVPKVPLAAPMSELGCEIVGGILKVDDEGAQVLNASFERVHVLIGGEVMEWLLLMFWSCMFLFNFLFSFGFILLL